LSCNIDLKLCQILTKKSADFAKEIYIIFRNYVSRATSMP